MFKFNFDSPSENKQSVEHNGKKLNDISWIDAKEIKFGDLIDCNQYLLENNSLLLSTTIGNTVIRYLSSAEIINLLAESNSLVMKTEQDHSDVITAIYEGGLKIWNGTFDLLEYLNKEEISLSNKNVLDLGCGNGLIGLYALLKGAEMVTFQDYNEDVIKYTTMPNIKINSCNIKGRYQFFAGDWKSFADKPTKNHFDFILTADTIYNSDNYEKLHAVFQSRLKKSGKIFLAAKTVYFGLSGGIKKFEQFLQEKEMFESKTVFLTMDGIQREILEIKHR